jgi:hypothetical protein
MSVRASVPERSDTVIEIGLRFGRDTPVRVHIVHRDHRVTVSDDGAAIDLAARPRRWREAGRAISDEYLVNITRNGTVSLPVVPAGPDEDEVIRRIGEASLAFYQELLELGD